MARIYKRKVKKTYRKKRVVKRGGLTDLQKMQVRKLMGRNLEKKTQYYESGNIQMANFGNTTLRSNNTVMICPNAVTLSIGQGTAQNQRVGNSIRTKYADFRFSLRVLPYNATSNSVPQPQICAVYIWSIKSAVGQELSDAQSIASSTVLQQGSTSVGFQATLGNYLSDINKDEVILHKRYIFKVGAATYAANTGTQANYFSNSNNDFKMTILKKVNITKFLAKEYKFNDSNNNVTSGRTLFATFVPMDFDGGVPADTTAAVPMDFEYRLNYTYTDA